MGGQQNLEKAGLNWCSFLEIWNGKENLCLILPQWFLIHVSRMWKLHSLGTLRPVLANGLPLKYAWDILSSLQTISFWAQVSYILLDQKEQYLARVTNTNLEEEWDMSDSAFSPSFLCGNPETWKLKDWSGKVSWEINLSPATLVSSLYKYIMWWW